MSGRKPTIKDVARLAGVSPMTASRVANNSANVRQEKQLAVRQAMKALRYVPDAAAQSMRTQKTRRIGFMLPDITNLTNAAVSLAVERRLAQERYQVMMFNTDFQVATELEVLAMGSHNIFDGLIAALTDDTHPAVAAALAASTVPVVLIDRDCGTATDAVYGDHRTAMRAVVAQLVHLGHRRIGLVAPSRLIRAGRERVAGFIAARTAFGLDAADGLIWTERQSIGYGREAAIAMLKSDRPPTAIIAGANQQTMGVYQAIQELGLAIPDDISFVGADDPYLASLLSPPITVIYRDMDVVGRHAAEIMLRRLRDKAALPRQIVTVPSEIASRSSIGPAKS